MKLIFDSQLVSEQISENQYVLYSPFNHTVRRINTYFMHFINIIVQNDGVVDENKLADSFKEVFNYDLTSETIAELVTKLINSSIFFANLESYQKKISEVEKEKSLSYENMSDYNQLGQAYLHMTLRCNFNCVYCYNREAAKGYTKELSTEQWLEVIDKLSERGVKKFIFTGGEPLLRDDLAAVMKKTKDKGGECILLTNGSLLKPYFDQIVPLADNITMSLDSFNQSINAANRSMTNYGDILDLLDRFSREAPEKLLVTQVITQSNKHEVREFKKTLEEKYGIRSRMVFFIPTTPDQIEEVVPFDEIFEQVAGNSCVSPYKPIFRVFRCGAGKFLIAVNPEGDVFPCQSFLMDEFKMTNMLKDDWYQEFKSSSVRKTFTEMSVEQMDKCSGCSYRYFCGGGCPAISHKLYSSYNAHIPIHCDFFKHEAKQYLKNINIDWEKDEKE